MTSEAGKKADRELLAQFAKDAGVLIVACKAEWGGKIAYTERDYPNSRICGFRAENAAYKHWLESKFGTNTARAVMKLMRRAALAAAAAPDLERAVAVREGMR